MSERKNVLLAGDSISMGYGPGVRERLCETCDVAILPDNGGTSRNLLAHLDEWFLLPGFDLIHLNCGLHDVARDRGADGQRVALEQYGSNLRDIFHRLRQETGALLAWATTTPVIDKRHSARKGFDRYEEDVQAYNAVALRLAREAVLPVNDLHRVIERSGPESAIGPDGVHMTEAGNEALADAVAEFISRLIPRPG